MKLLLVQKITKRTYDHLLLNKIREIVLLINQMAFILIIILPPNKVLLVRLAKMCYS